MTRSKRAAFVGFMLVASQLASGCCCVRDTFWRWRCAPCNDGCAPRFSARVAMPPIATPPVASAPIFHGGPVHHGGPDCPTCVGPAPVVGYGGYGGYVGPAGGIPTIGNPMPLGGPTVEPSRELPHPMPLNKDKN